MLEFLYTPQEDINYKFIASLYTAGVALAVLFAVLDVVYLIEEIKGFWIIFCPFAPALLWSVYMMTRALPQSTVEKQPVKDKEE